MVHHKVPFIMMLDFVLYCVDRLIDWILFILVAVAEHPNDSSLLNRLTGIGKDGVNKSIATHFSDGWWRKVEVEKPPDVRSRSDRQYFTGSNVDLMYSSRKDDSNSSSDTAHTPTLSPPLTPQSISEEDEANMVFNIVIQKERAEKSAFIAPDVNWLRDLVPKVVDVADKPELLIKETIVNAMDNENAIDVEQMRDRQLFINVVKSEIGSEVEVPEILARLRNLMRTGGPAVESILLEGRDIGVPQKLIYVINIIIFNFVVLEAAVEKPILITDKISNIEHDITEDSYLVALKESQQNRFGSSSIGRNKIQVSENVENNQPRIPDSAIEEDSYITALRESQKNRNNKVSSPVINHHLHHHPHAKPHHGPHIVTEEASHQFNGHYLTEVPTYAYASTARPLMAMEKDYLRRFTIKPTQQPVDMGNKLEQLVNEEEQSADEVDQPADEQELLTSMPEHLPTVLVDPNASMEFVNLPTGPYFTNPAVDTVQIVNTEPSSIEKPPDIEAVVFDIADTVGNNNNQIQATTRKPVVKKPMIVRVPEAVGAMTNKATNIVRNRIRTVSMLGIPMMVGLASTVNSWLPSVIGLGRRKRRSINLQETHHNRNPSRAIEVAQTLARLMGKHYASEESPRKTIDDQEESSVPVDDSNKPVKVSPNRSLWFPFRRPANTRLNSGNIQRRPGARRSAFARKMKEMKSNTRKYMTPLFYTTFFANENAPEIMERTEPTIDDTEQRDGILEPPQVTEDVMEHREDVAVNEEDLDNLTEHGEVVEDVMEHREAKEDAESTEPLVSSAVGPPVEYDDYKPEETETQMEEKMYENVEEETSQTLPAFNSPSGFDFDIVSNFVRAMMMNNQENNKDSPEAREEVFWIKEATIVNTTETGNSKFQKGSSMLLLKPGGASTRLPSSVISGNKVSVFSADPLRPNYINSENVTNNPLTYVSIKSPTKVTWLGVGPPDALTSSTQSTSSAEMDATGEINDSPLDLPPSEIVGAPLQFYDEETDNYVSKEVPSVPGSPTASYYTDQAPITERIPSNDIPSEQSPAVIVQEISEPVRPLWQSTDLRPGLSNLLLTIASFNRPRLPPTVEVSNSIPTIKYTLGQGFVTSHQDEFNGDTTDKYTHGHGIVSKPDDVSKYTHGHGTIVTNAPVDDLNLLTGESSLVSDTVANSNMLSNLFKGTGNNQNGESTLPTLLGETSIQFVGMYGGTSVDSTVGPFTATGISDSEELHSTLDNLITQLQANLTTGLVSTDRPMGGIHFTNTSTDIVIINPFVTPSSVFPQLQVEAVEAEEGETSGAIENADEAAISSADTIVVDALEGTQPDSVPNVSNLANLFFASSGGGGSSGGISGGSFPSDVSSGGVTGDSVSSSNTNPIALLYTFGLAAVGVLLLTLPIWIPFVVTRIKRRTYAPSKTYSASKKKPSYGYSSSPPRKTYAEPPLNHYKDMDEDEMYGNDHYLDQHQLGSGPTQPQYQSTTIEDLYRPNAGDVLSSTDYALNSEDHYIFRDSIALNPQDNMFSHAGPLSSEAIYGSPARIYLKARRRRSSRFKRSNKR